MVQWDWAAFFNYLRSVDILRGVWTTVWLTAISMTAGIFLGLFSALLLRLNHPLTKAFYSAYTTVIRGTPLLVQLVFAYTALPRFGIRLSVAESAILALSVNEGAYVAEIMRAAIDSVHRGQMEAATALGMTYWKAMRVVILPQAARTAAPVIGNQVNSMLKATSLVSVISMEELFRTTQELIQSTFRVLELFTVASIYYLILTTLWGFVQRALEGWLEFPSGRTTRQTVAAAADG
ncbi:MAG: amino acid ABC transporter permease [Vulcanimicrobiaceae bacterium]